MRRFRRRAASAPTASRPIDAASGTTITSAWFDCDTARRKLHAGQVPLIGLLLDALGDDIGAGGPGGHNAPPNG